MDEVTKKLTELASKIFGIGADALKPGDDFFQKLGVNSLRAMDLVREVELEFDIEIPDSELKGVRTISKLAEIIEKRK